jgi:2-C-methyl-D-erythritol 4-phosphate cytidylyltransferase/2-C-methyl-D-erythritol 2,4-cyclodiphosphate synthase
VKTVALVLAAGEGKRMKSSTNKHFLPLLGKPLLLHTLQAFQDHPLIQEIVLVGSPDGVEKHRALVENAGLTKLLEVVPGGKTRQESCWLGLQCIETADLVAVHDGARPLVAEGVITRAIQAAAEHGAAIAAVPAKDTLKEVGEQKIILRTPDRNSLWQAQTPQVFRLELLRQAHQAALRDNFLGTDEAILVERLGVPVRVSEGDYHNLKITTSEDLITAEHFMSQRQVKPESQVQAGFGKPPSFRVGLGHDSHRFVDPDDPKPLVMGGVWIEGHRGLSGNSDSDVILHAIFNALSQAAGEHSLGYYADPLCLEQGITDSREYLKIAHGMAARLGYSIANVGVSVECRTPRLEDISEHIQENVASLLGVAPGQVGITVTSGEGLTAFGRGEGIQAWAVVSLVLE